MIAQRSKIAVQNQLSGFQNANLIADLFNVGQNVRTDNDGLSHRRQFANDHPQFCPFPRIETAITADDVVNMLLEHVPVELQERAVRKAGRTVRRKRKE